MFNTNILVSILSLVVVLLFILFIFFIWKTNQSSQFDEETHIKLTKQYLSYQKRIFYIQLIIILFISGILIGKYF